MNRLTIAVLVVCAFLLGGCGDPQTTVSTVADSAGIEIVSNSTPIWRQEQAWSLAPEPEIDIGVQEGEPEYELYRPDHAARLSDGGIVVGNTGSLQLRYYDRDGLHIGDVGSRGGGPGEFQRISWMGVWMDSVVVYDQTQRRLTVFSSRGKYVRSLSLEVRTGSRRSEVDPSSYFPVIGGVLSDGSFLGHLRLRARGRDLPTGIIRDSMKLLRIGQDGAITDEIGTFPDLVRDVQTRALGDRSIRGPADVAFSPRFVWATGGDVTFVGTTDSYEISVFDLEGALIRIVRKQHQPIEITETHRDQLVARWREIYAGNLDNPEVKYSIQALEDSPLPQVFPAFDPEDRDERGWRVGTPLIVDAEGNLWVLEYRPPGDSAPVWSVFDRTGRFLGTVTVPDGLRVTEIGGDYVLGWWTDETGVPHVRSYRLLKP